MIKNLKRLATILLPISTTACHGFVTSPFLWTHHSSAAFEVNAFLWIANILLLYVFIADYYKWAVSGRQES